MSDFEKKIHDMFDHIWDCEINHPIFRDTVGELMTAVIKCYELVTSEQKTGRWLTSDDMFETGICPYCGWDSGEPVRYARENFNYCPKCGEKMAVSGEEKTNE